MLIKPTLDDIRDYFVGGIFAKNTSNIPKSCFLSIVAEIPLDFRQFDSLNRVEEFHGDFVEN